MEIQETLFGLACRHCGQCIEPDYYGVYRTVGDKCTTWCPARNLRGLHEPKEEK